MLGDDEASGRPEMYSMAAKAALLGPTKRICATSSIANRIRERKFSAFWIVALSGIVSLLLILAILQYRWTRQLNVATEVGIGSGLAWIIHDFAG